MTHEEFVASTAADKLGRLQFALERYKGDVVAVKEILHRMAATFEEE